MRNDYAVRRGDIYFADLGETKGSVQSGFRPVLVIQNDVGNVNGPTVIAAAITSRIKKLYMPVHVLLGENYGLREYSMLETEQVMTLDKSQLVRYIGHIDEKYMGPINKALLTSLGLGSCVEQQVENRLKEEQWKHAVDTQPHSKDRDALLLTLCPVCVQQYYNSPDHIVVRRRMHQAVKETCIYCNVRSGWDYRITRKPRRESPKNLEVEF